MIIQSEFENVTVTIAQMVSLYRLYQRYLGEKANKTLGENLKEPTLAFDKWIEHNVSYPSYDTCVMVKFPHITLGIEKDGYTHS